MKTIFGMIGLLCQAELALADFSPPPELLAQPERPTISQILTLLGQTDTLPPLENRKDLPRDQDKLDGGYQNNFPLWLQALESNCPKMITAFEGAFPGATWAFIGRDMDIHADCFEAFYGA